MLSHIKIEDKDYPTIIMGEDHFSGWFAKSGTDYPSEELRAKSYLESISVAYQLGARGFSVSPHPTIMKVLADFKEKHPDIICIANPHYRKNYYLDNESLWTSNNLGRLTSTIFHHLKNPEYREVSWFKDVDDYLPFSEYDIANFRLDENEYQQNISEFVEFCDFSLVGNIHRSALLLLDRQDLVVKESEMVRKTNMIPILMCESGALAIAKSIEIDCAGYWIYMNEDFGFPSLGELLNKIKNINKPITAYKAFTRSDGFNVQKTINFFRKIKQVKSLVVGIKNATQAQETFSQLAL
jgi:hypothetical protein